jgi:hypothetical protein
MVASWLCETFTDALNLGHTPPSHDQHSQYLQTFGSELIECVTQGRTQNMELSGL